MTSRFRAALVGWVVASALGGSAATTLADQCAFVTNTASGNISIIDIAANAVSGTIPVPGGSAIVIDSGGVTAYVVHTDTVSVIDIGRQAVAATVPVGRNPVSIALTPDGRHAYVANRRSDSISVIGTAADAVIGTIDLPDREDLLYKVAFFGPAAVAVSPDGARLYVSRDYLDERLEAEILIYDTATSTIVDRTGILTGGENLRGIAISPDGAFLYGAAMGGAWDGEWWSSVAVIDILTNRFRPSIPIAWDPDSELILGAVGLTPDGASAYVANTSRDTVVSVSTMTERVTAEIAVGMRPRGLAMTADGSRAYVTNEASGTVSAISTASNTVVATIAVGGHPQGIAIASVPEGCSANVSSSDSRASGGCSVGTLREKPAHGPTMLVVLLAALAWIARPTVRAHRAARSRPTPYQHTPRGR